MTDRDQQRNAPGAMLHHGRAGRRTLLLGAGALGVAGAGVLAACGDDGATSTGTTSTGTTSPGGGDPPAGATAEPPAAGGGGIRVADIPVGSGKIYTDQRVVVTQPTAGDYKAFDAMCTHLGCVLSSVNADKIRCACHGSEYNVTDGSVARGPATEGLAAKAVTVSGDGGTLTVS